MAVKNKDQRDLKKYEHEIRIKTFIDNMFYEEDFLDYDYTDNKAIINNRIIDLQLYLENLGIENKLKENILNNKEFLVILSHFNIIELLNKYSDEAVIERIYELVEDYDNINNFFKDKEAFTILNLYGIVKKDDNGFYKINNNIVNAIIHENGYSIKDIEPIKQLISDNWENQKEIITQNKLDEYSEKRNGISFKYFLFCEEYIKSGKITDVSKNLGIGRRTCYDYLQRKDVKKYLQERQEEIKNENTNLMKQRFNECFDTLYSKGVSHTEYVRDDIQIKAIDTFLKHYENSILKNVRF